MLITVSIAALTYCANSHFFEEYVIRVFNEQRSSILQYYALRPVYVTVAYVAFYVVCAALTIPIAVPLTLAGGMIFGFWPGTLLVSLSSTIGATLSFLASRYLFRDLVHRRFSRQVETVNRSVERDGAYYLFTARLIPVFPFFLMNLLLGLTSMRTWTYFWVSLVGMLAGTMVYVNAGVEIGRLDSHSDVFSPGLIAAFFYLGGSSAYC
jgi:uncharacterized membrane protein YdjX (TVP38/TMEM64 family)